MGTMTATEAARSFSEVLNRVAEGEEIAVTRNGATIAVIGPTRVRFMSGGRFAEVLKRAPDPDDAFADDLREAPIASA